MANKMTDLLKRRAAILAARPEVEIERIDRELAALRQAEAAQSDGERRARLATAEEARKEAAGRFLAALEALAPALAALEECEAAVLRHSLGGRLPAADERSIPSFARQFTKRWAAWRRNWAPRPPARASTERPSVTAPEPATPPMMTLAEGVQERHDATMATLAVIMRQSAARGSADAAAWLAQHAGA